jgi:hypothetical protein
MARATRDEDLDVREFDAGVLNDFLREKDVVEGYIGEIVDYTDKTHHLVDETNAAFDPAKEAEISTSLVRVSKAASAIAKKAKVRPLGILCRVSVESAVNGLFWRLQSLAKVDNRQ